ncbi:hypothetical protein L6452_16427 [Arctium lappa]|uniref:Uncharacterized protein n=1 Tax=Arctium lappa TaxID=4217 RepID=A0ACB9C0L0_ARCLA|nr:hypothetical protein L6452_16427 [Arctium lappa]
MSVSGVSTVETRRNKNEGRKRFTDKQISFLEYMFETQSRPELRMKHQVASKLGLHPRQVAIWFQNKRARSKSRQIEQEYNTLKHDYETLASKSESLKKENQALLNQLEMLRDVADRHQENTRRLDSTGNSSIEESDDRITNSPTKNDANIMLESYSPKISVPFYESVAYFGEESKFVDIEEQLCSVNDWEETTCDVPKWWEF